MTDESPAIDQLLKNLDQAMIADRHKLRRQLHELRKKPDDAKLAAWAERVQASCAQVTARAASVPLIRYDENLRFRLNFLNLLNDFPVIPIECVSVLSVI